MDNDKKDPKDPEDDNEWERMREFFFGKVLNLNKEPKQKSFFDDPEYCGWHDFVDVTIFMNKERRCSRCDITEQKYLALEKEKGKKK